MLLLAVLGKMFCIVGALLCFTRKPYVSSCGHCCCNLLLTGMQLDFLMLVGDRSSEMCIQKMNNV